LAAVITGCHSHSAAKIPTFNDLDHNFQCTSGLSGCEQADGHYFYISSNASKSTLLLSTVLQFTNNRRDARLDVQHDCCLRGRVQSRVDEVPQQLETELVLTL